MTGQSKKRTGFEKSISMGKNAGSPFVEVSSKRPFQNLLRSRITAVFGAVILIALISGWFFMEVVVGFAESNERRHFISRSMLASLDLDQALIADLEGSPGDAEKASFKTIRDQLIKIRNYNPDIRFVYLMGLRDGAVVFLANAEPATSENYSKPGDVYEEASQELFRIFADGKPFVEGPLTDRWGIWVSSHAPVFDDISGKVIAILDLDIDAKTWKKTISHYRLFSLTITGLIILILLISAATLFKLKLKEEKIKEYSENLEGMVEKRTDELNKALSDTEDARDQIDGILKSVADGLIVTDMHNRVVLMNPAAEDLLNVRFSSIFNRPIDFAIKDKALLEKIKNTFGKTAIAPQFDFELPDDDPKRPRIMRARSAVIFDKKGAETGIVTLVQDVTYEREIDRMKSEFITTAAHELRTPLTSIQGFSELLLTRDNLSDEDKKEFYKIY